MRPIKISGIVVALSVVTIALFAFAKPRALSRKNGGEKGFAVVELFTSEGCSSCPPADQLVAKIQKESKDQPVYILTYHVDYWNRLGWKDVFSSADFSRRQNDYANYLHLQSVYTPQIVVNGKTEFVGSEEGKLRSTIHTDLQKNPTSQLVLTMIKKDNKAASLKYTTEGTDNNTELLLAVLQKSAQSKVIRGENAGHTLSHVQIVRKLQQVSLKGNGGSASLALPDGFDGKNWEIIGFLQNKLNGAVLGATKVTIN